MGSGSGEPCEPCTEEVQASPACMIEASAPTSVIGVSRQLVAEAKLASPKSRRSARSQCTPTSAKMPPS
eukprot:scaffold30751_cov25-Tisochrysis_lutea.AAC.2